MNNHNPILRAQEIIDELRDVLASVNLNEDERLANLEDLVVNLMGQGEVENHNINNLRNTNYALRNTISNQRSQIRDLQQQITNLQQQIFNMQTQITQLSK